MLSRFLADTVLNSLKKRPDFSSLWNSLTEESQNKIFEQLVVDIKVTMLQEAYEKYAP